MGIKKLVIASILKPVDDTRMYEKFSISLAKTNKYEINIIGFSTKKIPTKQNVTFHPVFNFPRMSVKRLMASFLFFKILLQIKPDLIITTTYELLLPSVVYHWFWRGKIIYDIRENYARNVTSNHGMPKPLRYFWACMISAIEWGTRPWIVHYILAEKGYSKELDFIGRKFTILENKVILFDHFQKPAVNDNKTRFIYSGTITKSYGIYQAINLYLDIKKIVKDATFLIIGHFPYAKDYQQIRAIAGQNPSLTVKGGLSPVPHRKILNEIGKADIGIVSHQPVASIENCFPTRIYEYMAFQLPIIVQDHPLWATYCQAWDSAIVIDYNNYHCSEVIEQIREKKFYKKGVPPSIFWQNEEEKKLLELILLVIGKH